MSEIKPIETPDITQQSSDSHPTDTEIDNKDQQNKSVTFKINGRKKHSLYLNDDFSSDSLPSPIESNHPFRVSTENFLTEFGEVANSIENSTSFTHIDKYESIDENLSFQNGGNLDEFSPKLSSPRKDSELAEETSNSEHMITSFYVNEISPDNHNSPFSEVATSDFEVSFDDQHLTDNEPLRNEKSQSNDKNSSVIAQASIGD